MQGKRVDRSWGWDCHGLPIENIAEKSLEIKNKNGIKELGIDKFNDHCRSTVMTYADEWETVVARFGRWVDFSQVYKTMDNNYIESIWWAFKQMHEKEYVYEDRKVLMFCPRCETPLSNAETAMDNSYKDVTETTATAKFKLKNEENTYILAWTTTPWTLIGNVTLAVNKDLEYVKFKDANGAMVIAAKAFAEKEGNNFEVLETLKGADLIDLEYEPLYVVPTDGKKGYYVIDGGEEVSAEDGTGVVHMALYGEFDYAMIKKYDLPQVQHINESGKLEIGPKEWLGTWFKKVDKLVLEDLEERSLLFAQEDHLHSYPFCYRCDTPLFYNAISSWFINVQKAKERLFELNNEVNWHPSFLREGRFFEYFKRCTRLDYFTKPLLGI